MDWLLITNPYQSIRSLLEIKYMLSRSCYCEFGFDIFFCSVVLLLVVSTFPLVCFAIEGCKKEWIEMSSVAKLTVISHWDNSLDGATIISVEREYANNALQFYEKTQDDKLEIVQVLFSNRAKLVIPGLKGVGLWCHVSFIVKPENSDIRQHIFCEIVLDRDSEKYNVTYCSKFEPSDPGNVNGCVFCPAFEIFVHPPGGCPAGAQENDNLMTQGVVASKDQIRRCSKRHKSRPNVVFDNVATEMFDKARKVIKLKYAKIALEIFRKSKDAEFEIVEVLHAISKRVVVPGSKSIEEWYHVSFIAKPTDVDCIDFSSKHFFGELLRDTTTGEYNATYCEIFKPSDRSVTHNCIICPQPWKHPFKGYHVGRLPYSIAEDE